MVDSSPVTWLHISDFHFDTRNGYDRDVVLQSFLKSLPDLMSRAGRPDMVFATGDIAYSGRENEYALASSFFDELLEIAGLSKAELFIIPGNHDVDRQKGKGLARTFLVESDADEYFDPDEDLLHIAHRLGAYKKWYDNYFLGYRSFSLNTTFSTSETITVKNSTVRIFPINTATFCYGDDDHGKLFLGRRSLSKAMLDMTVEEQVLNVGLMHHPLEWLSPLEQSSIKSTLRERLDCILSGHLHETDAEMITGLSGNSIHLSAGAMYQTRKWPNTAMLCSWENDQLLIYPLRYGDKPHEIWTLDTNVFPRSPDYRGTLKLARLSNKARNASVPDHSAIEEVQKMEDDSVTAILLASPASGAKVEFEQDLFVAPSGGFLYVEPRLMAVPQKYTNEESHASERISVLSIIASENSYIIESRAEYGSSTLAKRLISEYEATERQAYKKDARDLPNYKKKLEAAFPVDCTSSKGSVLILDNFDPERDERLLKELISTEWFSKMVVITVNRGVKPTFVNLEGINLRFSKAYLWPVAREDIRTMATKLFDSADSVFISSVVDKVYGDLLGLCIPLTPSNVIMYLRVLHREGEFRPLNRVDILGRYLVEVLRRPSDAYSDSFNAQNKLDVLGAFVFSMYKRERTSFDDREWHAFVGDYQIKTLTEFDGFILLQEFIDGRILIRSAGKLYLKYSFFFCYFLGRYIAHRPTLLSEFLESESYLRIGGVVDVITGLSAENTILVQKLTSRLDDMLCEFADKYLPSDFDPLARAKWSDDNNEEKLWSIVSAEIEAGPKSVSEIDAIKTSALAEIRTQDQEVKFAAFLKMETALFLLSRLLTDALKNCGDIDGNLKVEAYNNILKSHLVGFQLGCVFSRFLANKSIFKWGGVVFIGFDEASSSEDSFEKILAVINSVCTSVIDRCQEEIGSHKLAAVFKAFDNKVQQAGIKEVMNFACILSAKGYGWQDTLAKIINRMDRNSYYLSAVLNVLMHHVNVEVMQGKDRDAVKRLIAIIQAKRVFKTQVPGSKIVSKVLGRLEEVNHFEKSADSDV